MIVNYDYTLFEILATDPNIGGTLGTVRYNLSNIVWNYSSLWEHFTIRKLEPVIENFLIEALNYSKRKAFTLEYMARMSRD